jgi:hypothetical protein
MQRQRARDECLQGGARPKNFEQHAAKIGRRQSKNNNHKKLLSNGGAAFVFDPEARTIRRCVQ